MQIGQIVALRSTCRSARTGCALVRLKISKRTVFALAFLPIEQVETQSDHLLRRVIFDLDIRREIARLDVSRRPHQHETQRDDDEARVAESGTARAAALKCANARARADDRAERKIPHDVREYYRGRIRAGTDAHVS